MIHSAPQLNTAGCQASEHRNISEDNSGKGGRPHERRVPPFGFGRKLATCLVMLENAGETYLYRAQKRRTMQTADTHMANSVSNAGSGTTAFEVTAEPLPDN